MNPVVCVHLTGMGLLGPGASDWAQGRHHLQALAQALEPVPAVAPQCLPPTERRRAGPVAKTALSVAEQACRMAGLDPASLATVFTSSTGEPSNCHALCESLAAAERSVSPTRFTNSVHNAPAGYWHIAHQGMQPSTSLAALDCSWAAGLLEAVAQVADTGKPVLFVSADVPYPHPLSEKRQMPATLGMAWVLEPSGEQTGARSLGRLELNLLNEAPAIGAEGGRACAASNPWPSAQALPLLSAMAATQALTVDVEHAPGAWVRVGWQP
jgi:hypothetical protein